MTKQYRNIDEGLCRYGYWNIFISEKKTFFFFLFSMIVLTLVNRVAFYKKKARAYRSRRFKAIAGYDFKNISKKK